MADKKGDKNTSRSWKTWIFLACIILLIIIVRVRVLEIPLERDEGEYAYMGQLMLQGIPPYAEAYNMKFPGTSFTYAIGMFLFGQTIQGIHLWFMIVNCAAIILVFLLARKFSSDGAALAAGAAYALLSLSSSVLGTAAHATHFVVLPALGGVLVLINALRQDKVPYYLWSGILFGLAILMKQPGIFFFLFGFIMIIHAHVTWQPTKSRRELAAKLGMFSIGGAAPLMITVVYLFIAGVFGSFWFWVFNYASAYVSQESLPEAVGNLLINLTGVADGFFLLWIVAIAGFIPLFTRRDLKDKRVFISLFVLFSFLTVTPGFYFRPHYFVTLLPAIALLTAISIDWINFQSAALLKALRVGIISALIFILAAGVGIASQWNYLFTENPLQLSRTLYGVNPFRESLEIAGFIESHSVATDRIAVFGSEPQIYFYSKRRAATGHIYVYGLMEKHDYNLAMQKEMIHEVVSADPKFIVLVPIGASWLRGPHSETYLLAWIKDYVERNYKLVGVADIISPETTVYKWYGDAPEYAMQSPSHILVFERSATERIQTRE